MHFIDASLPQRKIFFAPRDYLGLIFVFGSFGVKRLFPLIHLVGREISSIWPSSAVLMRQNEWKSEEKRDRRGWQQSTFHPSRWKGIF